MRKTVIIIKAHVLLLIKQVAWTRW